LILNLGVLLNPGLLRRKKSLVVLLCVKDLLLMALSLLPYFDELGTLVGDGVVCGGQEFL
jgi:hypothetical protein